MFERFTDGARRVVVYAQEESRLLRHTEIGTEHLLLGLLHDEADDTAQALAAVGVSLNVARQRLEQAKGRGKNEPHGHIPFTSRAKQALAQSLRQAQRLGQDHIDRPNLLRGLLEVSDGQGLTILRDLGVDLDQLAAAADELALRTHASEGQPQVIRSSAAGSVARASGPVGFTRPMSPGRLAHERRQLAQGLQRYGRHDDGCDPTRGCTCGLGPLLELAGD